MSTEKDKYGLMDCFGLDSDDEDSSEEQKSKEKSSNHSKKEDNLEWAPAQIDFTEIKKPEK
jgi:hypothetical protein